MSIDAIRWAWTVQGLRPAQKLILLSLADRADERHMCWPSLPRLSLDTGLDERTITLSMRKMCDAGIISRVETPGKGYVYTLLGVSGREDTPLKNEGAKMTPIKNDPPQKCSTPPPFLQNDPPQKCRSTRASTNEPKEEEPKENPKKSLHRDGENADPVPATPPPRYELPLRCKAQEKPRTFAVTREFFDVWCEAYPLVDVRGELRAIKAWLISNPQSRPRSDMARFVNSWLKRTQNEKAGKAAASARASPGREKPLAQRNAETMMRVIRKMEATDVGGSEKSHSAYGAG